mmetsp:Transcript_16845/g.67969  ORF Transcript_16845/g.67969 Transcript_16845/m.67969 type:complete len:335 (+) Transcript_16845:256-1260(+)
MRALPAVDAHFNIVVVVVLSAAAAARLDGQVLCDVVGDEGREGHAGEHGVDAGGGREERGVGDVESGEVPGLAVGVDDGGRGVGAHAAGAHLVGREQTERVRSARVAVDAAARRDKAAEPVEVLLVRLRVDRGDDGVREVHRRHRGRAGGGGDPRGRRESVCHRRRVAIIQLVPHDGACYLDRVPVRRRRREPHRAAVAAIALEDNEGRDAPRAHERSLRVEAAEPRKRRAREPEPRVRDFQKSAVIRAVGPPLARARHGRHRRAAPELEEALCAFLLVRIKLGEERHNGVEPQVTADVRAREARAQAHARRVQRARREDDGTRLDAHGSRRRL